MKELTFPGVESELANAGLFLVNLTRNFLYLMKRIVMKIMSVGEFKANFSEALKRVLSGEEIGISYGKKKEIVAKLVPKIADKKPKRKLGILEGKVKVKFGPDFKITEEEFLGI